MYFIAFRERMGRMFKINDTVFYGIHGVCTITDITARDFGGGKNDYYILKPVYSNRSTVFVPVDKAESANKMRMVVRKAEIKKIIKETANAKSLWIENDTKRKEFFSEIIKNAEIKELVSLYKTISEQREKLAGTGKKLHAVDVRAISEAEKMISEEFSFALGIEREEVFDYISKNT